MALRGGVFAFAVTFVVCALVFGARRAFTAALDHTGSEPQKVHSIPVPRIGGIAILAGIAGGAVFLDSSEQGLTLLLLLCASMPAFFAGLLEDLTKRYSVRSRLIATFAAAAIAFFLLDARVTDLALPYSETAFQVAFVSFLFTLFAVGGLAHAFNIVDGFNGLSGMVALLMLAGLSVVAGEVGDAFVAHATLMIGGAVLGFLLWNYPKGVIFAGDGGAYLLGFLIAELAVLLVHRNSDVSPWFALLLLFYPVWETLFSSYRRKVLRGRPPSEADALHLHTLIYQRLVRWKIGSREPRHKRARNALTAPYVLFLSSFTVIPAMLAWNNTLVLQLCAAGFAVLYLWLYRRIVRFRAPRFAVLGEHGVVTDGARKGLSPVNASGINRVSGRPVDL